MVDDPRLIQANERTLLAWLRTGVSLITFGFVIARTAVWLKLNQVQAITIAGDTIGTVFVFLGAATEAIGLVRYLRIRRALLDGRPVMVGATEIIAMAAAISVLGLLLGVFTML